MLDLIQKGAGARVGPFSLQERRLHAEDVPIADIAAEVGTPFYCYSTATFERHYKLFQDALAGLDCLICYAVKANSNLAVLRTLGRLGSGADVVSEGEFRRALAAGIPGERVIFSGVGKSAANWNLRSITTSDRSTLNLNLS